MGLGVAGLAVLGLGSLFIVLKHLFGADDVTGPGMEKAIEVLTGFSLGAESIALLVTNLPITGCLTSENKSTISHSSQSLRQGYSRLIMKSAPARWAKPGARILHRYGRLVPSLWK